MNGAYLKKVQFIMILQVETITIINRNYTKEVAKQVLRNAIVTSKKSFNILSYKHDTKL